MDSAINYSQFVLLIQLSYGLATKTGGANGETRLRGMRDTGSHFYFGRLSRRCSPFRVALPFAPSEYSHRRISCESVTGWPRRLAA
jgi:hypothetical protein